MHELRRAALMQDTGLADAELLQRFAEGRDEGARRRLLYAAFVLKVGRQRR